MNEWKCRLKKLWRNTNGNRIGDKKINGIIILDACHSGINARNVFSPLVIDKMNDTGCITLASCSENQESKPYPEQELGVFTYYLQSV